MLAAHYRAQAATLRALAEGIEDPKERARFFDVAAEYEKLAVYAQRRSENAKPQFQPHGYRRVG